MKAKNRNQVDGEIYLLGSAPPPPPSYDNPPTTDEENGAWGEFQPYYIEEAGRTGDRTLFERTLFKTKDPTTPPNTRQKCVRYASIKYPPMRFCTGWKVQFRWLYAICVLKVTTSTPVNIEKAVEDCLRDAAIVALITAIVSGGTAAIPAAESALKACLLGKLGNNLLTVSIALQHKRGNWE